MTVAPVAAFAACAFAAWGFGLLAVTFALARASPGASARALALIRE